MTHTESVLYWTALAVATGGLLIAIFPMKWGGRVLALLAAACGELGMASVVLVAVGFTWATVTFCALALAVIAFIIIGTIVRLKALRAGVTDGS